ncbi:MAG: cytochrome P450 [Chloroflexi bacterium]|nr:cytochrome P450 [Chloroflexota bacterium]MCI0579346.1 cytochrome P450 [Chloroflexota bacterium]MCI0646021.1 cytochrome P450 [Chloroflexota bacterium]MCI0727443.1 cytochrome P450 [Chloroflexota bacterium]
MNNGINNLPQVNIAGREFKSDPYPFYARLRAEAPVYRTVLPDKQAAWLITRYDDVLMVLKDDQRFVKNFRMAKSDEQLAKLPWIPPMFKPFMNNLLDSDGDVHARRRSLIHKAFTPRVIEQMRGRVETLAHELLDTAARRGQMDLVRDYALPIPLTIISEILGVPPKDREKFHKWSKTLLSLTSAGNSALLGIPPILAVIRYLRRIINERRRNPQDDLITALVQVEEAGSRLTEDELLAMIFVLLIAGHETTVNLIASGALALLQHPDQMALLRRQPELIGSAVEELVRYTGPVEQATERYASEDVALHGVTIPKGEMVLAVLASANRDERTFDNPERLDIRRENNKHLGFGQGVHYCVGAPLARLEGQIAINALVQRLPNLRLAATPEALRWRPGLTVRGMEALPVAL